MSQSSWPLPVPADPPLWVRASAPLTNDSARALQGSTRAHFTHSLAEVDAAQSGWISTSSRKMSTPAGAPSM